LNYFHNEKQSNFQGLKIVAKEDYLLQQRFENNQTTKLALPKANVIKYFLDDGSWFVLRPSGTEPKMKVYISVVTNSRHDSILRSKEIEQKVMELINHIKGE